MIYRPGLASDREGPPKSYLPERTKGTARLIEMWLFNLILINLMLINLMSSLVCQVQSVILCPPRFRLSSHFLGIFIWNVIWIRVVRCFRRNPLSSATTSGPLRATSATPRKPGNQGYRAVTIVTREERTCDEEQGTLVIVATTNLPFTVSISFSKSIIL